MVVQAGQVQRTGCVNYACRNTKLRAITWKPTLYVICRAHVRPHHPHCARLFTDNILRGFKHPTWEECSEMNLRMYTHVRLVSLTLCSLRRRYMVRKKWPRAGARCCRLPLAVARACVYTTALGSIWRQTARGGEELTVHYRAAIHFINLPQFDSTDETFIAKLLLSKWTAWSLSQSCKNSSARFLHLNVNGTRRGKKFYRGLIEGLVQRKGTEEERVKKKVIRARIESREVQEKTK